MENFTLPYEDATTNNTSTVVGRDIKTWITLTIALMLFLGIFLFFIVLMLHAFFTTARLREQTRYILFIYTMLSDTLNLVTCVLLFLLTFALYTMPVGGCYVVVTIAASTFLSSRNGLAAMALERYVAICFPLRHPMICRIERYWAAIVVSSVIGFMPSLIDVMILSASEKRNFFFQRILCRREFLIVTPQQAMLTFTASATTFTVVALIILYTYLKIMLEAKKINGNKATSSKASKTVLLHALQLLLSLTSFTAPISENLLRNQIFYVRFLNYFLFILLPIFLSPLIYGFRDENIRHHIKSILTSAS
ncbi:odorant receptor 131-2-like [Lissotriton helveticus]